MPIAPESLNRAVFLLLYAPVCLLSVRWLFPRLSAFSKRLVLCLLVMQIAALLMALLVEPAPRFESWLWNLDWEFNIPSTLASLQLALVGALALLTAWLGRRRLPAFCLAGIGLVFLFFAWDEYFMLHEQIANWQRGYAFLGAAMAGASAFMALRTVASERIWQFCFLAGLAMSALGAVLFEELDRLCGDRGLFQISGCLYLYSIEEMLEFLGIWLVLVSMGGQFSAAMPKPGRVLRIGIALLPALWIGIVLLASLMPRIEWLLLAQPADVAFESQVALKGYRTEIDADSAHIWIYASAPARQWNYGKLGFSVHVVDLASGESLVGRDKHVTRTRDFWIFDAAHVPINRETMKVPLPDSVPANRALALAFSFWREAEGDFPLLAIASSELRMLGDRQAVLGEFALRAMAPPAISQPIAQFAGGFTLQAVDMPRSARAGEMLDITFAWRSDTDIAEDITQFLHLVHAESGLQWGHDQAPLGTRLPTRLWYSGMADSETWTARLPADLASGRYNVYTGLYWSNDLGRLTATDADGAAWQDDRVPLGSIVIE